MTPLEWAILVTLAILWGSSFFFNDVAVRELPTFTVVVCRVVLGAATLLLVMRLTGQAMPRSGEIWRAFLLMGLINNAIPFSLIVWGQSHIASGLASILNATTPLFSVLFAHWLTDDEKMTPLRVFGVFAGLVGVAVMIGGDAIASLGNSVLAQLACVAGACSYALGAIFGRRFKSMGVSPMATATGQVVASSIILLPIMLLIDRPWTLAMPSGAAIGALIGVAIPSTAVAYILYFRLLATAGATNLLLVTFLVPVTAIFLGISILGEILETRHLIGLATIAAGLTAIDGRPFAMLRRIAGLA